MYLPGVRNYSRGVRENVCFVFMFQASGISNVYKQELKLQHNIHEDVRFVILFLASDHLKRLE